MSELIEQAKQARNRGSRKQVDIEAVNNLINAYEASEEELEVYKSIAEEAIEVTSPHFDEGYGWSKSIEQLKEQG
tara:strand:- start:446 stop:670 length:225 start_codon:yes stop_codon:yes gene_type:complete